MKEALLTLPGIEKAYSRAEAVDRFRVMGDRIGDLVILGDKETVFGELEENESDERPQAYRMVLNMRVMFHGSFTIWNRYLIHPSSNKIKTLSAGYIDGFIIE